MFCPRVQSVHLCTPELVRTERGKYFHFLRPVTHKRQYTDNIIAIMGHEYDDIMYIVQYYYNQGMRWEHTLINGHSLGFIGINIHNDHLKSQRLFLSSKDMLVMALYFHLRYFQFNSLYIYKVGS